MTTRTLEVQFPGEPPTKGDALDWVVGILATMTPAQEAEVRSRVRALQARRGEKFSPLVYE